MAFLIVHKSKCSLDTLIIFRSNTCLRKKIMIEANLFILTNMKGHKMFCFVQILVYTLHEYVHFTLLINGIQIQSKFYLKSHLIH